MTTSPQRRSLFSGTAKSVVVLALVAGTVAGSMQAQQPADASSGIRAACALSGQTPELGPFDPNQADLVSHPQALSFDGKTIAFGIRSVARVLGVRPLIFEVLDTDRDPPPGMKPSPSLCERQRVYSIDAGLTAVLSTLHFGDLVQATMSMAAGTIGQMTLTHLQKVEGTPRYFHEQTGWPANRTGMLVQYRNPFGETLVVNNDGTILFRDRSWRVFNHQRVDPENLAQLMAAFHVSGFNSFPSRKWDVGDSYRPYIALACARFQQVLNDDHQPALAPVIQVLEKIEAKALANTYYLLIYGERREITFLDWPFPDIPLDQAEDLKRKEEVEEMEARRENRPKKGDFAAVHRKLPPEFLARLPRLYPAGSHVDPNQDVYFRDASRTYRVAQDPNGRRFPGTMYEVRVTEIVSAEAALTTPPILERKGLPRPRLTNSSTAFQWPGSMGFLLSDVPTQGRRIPNGDYSKHERVYLDLLHSGSVSNRGVDFVEGRFLYSNVRLDRLEDDVTK